MSGPVPVREHPYEGPASRARAYPSLFVSCTHRRPSDSPFAVAQSRMHGGGCLPSGERACGLRRLVTGTSADTNPVGSHTRACRTDVDAQRYRLGNGPDRIDPHCWRQVTAVAGLDAAGPAVTADSNGVFRFASIAGRRLHDSHLGNELRRALAPLSSKKTRRSPVQLDPVFQTVTTNKHDMVIGHPSCPGYWDSPTCDIPRTPAGEPVRWPYLFNVHHDGMLQTDLAWTDRRFGLGTDLCGSNGGQPTGQAVHGPAG